jgi:hypothetical protein
VFHVLDGAPELAPWAGILERASSVLPHRVTLGGWRDATAVLADVVREVERRLEADQPEAPEVFVFLSDLARFRTLRLADEFDFRSNRDPNDPRTALETILREGPSLGIHVLAWCDSMSNLSRIFVSAALHEFGAKVAFQMGSSDSVKLLDTQLASRLGPHRALLLDEEQGVQEKFRPYHLPPADWLDWAREQFRARMPGHQPANSDPDP